MSRWLEIAARAGGDSTSLPANRQEPAKRSGKAQGEDFLPVSAGLPVTKQEQEARPVIAAQSNVISLDKWRSRPSFDGPQSDGGAA